MKLSIKVISLCLMALLATTAYGKAKQTPVYLFGLAASFNDSTVFVTDIQKLDNAWVDQRTKFLMSRQEYSYQLRDYLATIGLPHMTCITFYALDKKKAEKKMASLMKRYTKKNHRYIIKHLSSDDFSYTVQQYNAAEEQLMDKSVKTKKSKQDRKKEKQLMKNAPKAKKKAFKAREGEATGTLF